MNFFSFFEKLFTFVSHYACYYIKNNENLRLHIEFLNVETQKQDEIRLKIYNSFRRREENVL